MGILQAPVPSTYMYRTYMVRVGGYTKRANVHAHGGVQAEPRLSQEQHRACAPEVLRVSRSIGAIMIACLFWQWFVPLSPLQTATVLACARTPTVPAIESVCKDA